MSDESGVCGNAEGICFPRTPEEVSRAVATARKQGRSVTIQGARTGICGGAVPDGGYIINMSMLKGFTGFSFDGESASIKVLAGTTLAELVSALETKEDLFSDGGDGSDSEQTWESWKRYKESGVTLCFPPNPSEKDATIGGILSCNALGGKVYARKRDNKGGANHRDDAGRGADDFGSVAEYVRRVCVVGPDGLFKNIHGQELSRVCGGEGLFCIVVEAELVLIKKPAVVGGLMGFFEDCGSLARFLEELERGVATDMAARVKIMSADYFGQSCFSLICKYRGRFPFLKEIPEMSARACGALWIEIWCDDEDSMMQFFENALALLERFEAEHDALAATEERDFARLCSLRHAMTQMCNELSRTTEFNFFDLVVADFARSADEIERFVSGFSNSFAIMGRTAAGKGSITIRLLDVTDDDGGSAEQAVQVKKAGCALLQYFKENGCVCSREYGIGRVKGRLFRELHPRGNPGFLQELYCCDREDGGRMKESGQFLFNPAITPRF